MAGGLFKKGLSDGFLGALATSAQQAGWWADVLADKGLIIAIRNEYLNVYWQGQSLFRVSFKAGNVTATTHPKYLIDPGLAKQVPLIGGAFATDEIAKSGIIERYEGKTTLDAMKRVAGLYAGSEKEGVHTIVGRSPSVIDVEVALSTSAMDEAAVATDKLGKLPRIDIAALEQRPDHVELVFWEAKLFSNTELRAKEDDARVVHQIAKYRDTLQYHRDELIGSYQRVAHDLVRIAEMSGGVRSASKIVKAVADGADLRLAEQPRVGLLVFDFDAAQRDGAVWRAHLDKLKKVLDPDRIKAAGSPKNISV